MSNLKHNPLDIVPLKNRLAILCVSKLESADKCIDDFQKLFDRDPAYALEQYSRQIFKHQTIKNTLNNLLYLYDENLPASQKLTDLEVYNELIVFIRRESKSLILLAPWEACSTNPISNVKAQQDASGLADVIRELTALVKWAAEYLEVDHAL